jgi:hypothetical protein
MVSKILFSSQRQNWKTPKNFYKELNKEFNFDFDPCPENPNFNGLEIEWGKRNFVNPPYSALSLWIKKSYDEWRKGKLVVMLIPARTDRKDFHEIILPYASEIRFIKGRLKFDDQKNSAPFPSMLVIFGGNNGKMCKV